MPLEIKELHIKATLSDTYQDQRTGGEGNIGGGYGNNAKEEIINECVEKVLQILKDKMER
jgi:hypothetical protein